MKIGGAPPEGPYLGHIPPTGQIPRRGPAAYPPGQVTAQAPSQESSPYGTGDFSGKPTYPQNVGKSPYGDGGVTAQPAPTTQPAPARPKYPIVLGKPVWLPPKGLEVRAYRFSDGHVYEFKTSLGDSVLTDAVPFAQRQDNQILIQGVYRDKNSGVVSLWPGAKVP